MRESLIQVTSTILIVEGVTYSLFIMLLKEMVSMELKGQPGAAPAASSLLSLQSSDRMMCFVFLHCPLTKSPEEGVYIIGFRSRRVCRVQDCVEMTLKAKGGCHHMARVVARVVGPLSCLVASPVDFFLSRSSIF
jgi:hypothetical protein